MIPTELPVPKNACTDPQLSKVWPSSNAFSVSPAARDRAGARYHAALGERPGGGH